MMIIIIARLSKPLSMEKHNSRKTHGLKIEQLKKLLN